MRNAPGSAARSCAQENALRGVALPVEATRSGEVSVDMVYNNPSARGPSVRTGKKVRAVTMTVTVVSKPTNSGR